MTENARELEQKNMPASSPSVLARGNDRVTVLFHETEAGHPLVVKVSPHRNGFARGGRARTLLAGAGLPVLMPIAYHEECPRRSPCHGCPAPV